MRLLWGEKDGGSESLVWCWGFESKRFGSLLLLKFGQGSREAFHTHAFHAVSWLLWGALHEQRLPPKGVTWSPYVARRVYHFAPTWWPILTKRSTYHMVQGLATRTWAVTMRGPWRDLWREYLPNKDAQVKLTHGRKETP